MAPKLKKPKPGTRAKAQAAPQWPADKVERRPLASVLPYARNARTHSDAQIAAIAASIKEWGWTMPLLIDESGELIAGHGRVLGAHKLGLTEGPVMIAPGWSQAKIRAYRIAENKFAELSGPSGKTREQAQRRLSARSGHLIACRAYPSGPDRPE